MDYDRSFFLHPKDSAQRLYEALRASFVDRLPARIVAERFGYSKGYVHLLRHRFKRGLIKLPFGEEAGRPGRPPKLSPEIREKIVTLRKTGRLSAGQIAELVEDQDGVDVSVRTVERVLSAAGLPRLPKRTHLEIGITRDHTLVPDTARRRRWRESEGQTLGTASAGVFLFLPFLEKIGIGEIIKKAKLPETGEIPALQYVLSLLVLKLLGRERLSHVDALNFDPALGLFAGLNILPKCTAISTYSYMLDPGQLGRFRDALYRQGRKCRLYGEDAVNLDFHTIPHYGDESVLEKNWAGARNKTVKGALTLLAQDSRSGLVIYSDADIKKSEADDQVVEFVRFYRRIRRRLPPVLVFDSGFTTYQKLAELDAMDVKFITLRRRGKKMVEKALKSGGFKTIHVAHAKRKFPHPKVKESRVELTGYSRGELRQIVMRGNGHEKPAFLITNDFERELEEIVSVYAERWRVEIAIAEAVKFFSLNALSSPILLKVYMDVLLTVLADTLYYMLAQHLRGFEDCHAPKINRHFIDARGDVRYEGGELRVTFPRKAHNPLLRAVRWDKLPDRISWLDHARLRFEWR
jgi:transposase